MDMVNDALVNLLVEKYGLDRNSAFNMAAKMGYSPSQAEPGDSELAGEAAVNVADSQLNRIKNLESYARIKRALHEGQEVDDKDRRYVDQVDNHYKKRLQARGDTERLKSGANISNMYMKRAARAGDITQAVQGSTVAPSVQLTAQGSANPNGVIEALSKIYGTGGF